MFYNLHKWHIHDVLLPFMANFSFFAFTSKFQNDNNTSAPQILLIIPTLAMFPNDFFVIY